MFRIRILCIYQQKYVSLRQAMYLETNIEGFRSTIFAF